MARTFFRRLARWTPVARFASLVDRLDNPPSRVLRVLTYHRVDRPEPFARHVELLAARYRVVSVAEVITALEGGAPLPRRSVLLTFDDGYRNFARVAWPILRARGMAAALFVPTAFPDSGLEAFWWDRLEDAFLNTTVHQPFDTEAGRLRMATPEQRARSHARVKAHVRELPHPSVLRMTSEICDSLAVHVRPHEVLGWAELRELAAQGVAIGAHTRSHPRLDRIRADQVRDEVAGSLGDIEREIPGARRIFAYPDGRHDDEIVEVLRSAGAELAFTTQRGLNDLDHCDPLRMRRVNVDARDPLEIVLAKLASTASFLSPVVPLFAAPSPARSAAKRARGDRSLQRSGRAEPPR